MGDVESLNGEDSMFEINKDLDTNGSIFLLKESPQKE